MQFNSRYLKIVFLLSTLLPFYLNAQPCREITGYYPSWKWYNRDKLVRPENINFSKYTIINYAFFNPLEDGSIVGFDPKADENILLGINSKAGDRAKSSLVEQAHLKGVKVLISIGGWTLSTHFPNIAADSRKRTKFASSCAELIRKYKLDGIDIDWEYPGKNGRKEDKQNFTLMMKELRDSLNACGSISGKEMYLTAAFGAGFNHMQNIEWDKVTPLLDVINLMTYDYFGTWDMVTNHNAPLYTPANGSNTCNLDASVRKLIEAYNVPRGKISLGIAYFARSLKTQTQAKLHAASAGVPDLETFGSDLGSPEYYNVMAKMNLFDQHWDELARVPYLTGKDGLNTFVSYDDPASVALKAKYAIDQHLKGVIIWEITGDYLETFPGSGVLAGTPLTDTLNAVFCRYNTSDLASEVREEDIISIPGSSLKNVELNLTAAVPDSQLKVVNESGQVVHQRKLDMQNKVMLDASAWPSGVYFINISSERGTSFSKILKL